MLCLILMLMEDIVFLVQNVQILINVCFLRFIRYKVFGSGNGQWPILLRKLIQV